MRTTLKFAIYFSAVFLLSACAPNILGTWNVSKYETIDQGIQGVVLNNLGTMTFDKDGVGKKMITYNLLGFQKVDSTDFKWKWINNLITIDGENTELSKTWIVVEDTKKSQVWKATDGAKQVQIIELKK